MFATESATDMDSTQEKLLSPVEKHVHSAPHSEDFSTKRDYADLFRLRKNRLPRKASWDKKQDNV